MFDDLINKLSPKTSFWTGVVGGILVLCTIGFLVMLVGFLSGGDFSFKSVKKADTTKATDTFKPIADPAGSDVPTVVKIAPITDKDHIRGKANAKVVLVEYSDTECPFCKQHHEVLRGLMEQYGKDVAWIYRHFPLDSLHSKARKEAEATECAASLGGNDVFWKYLDEVFARTPSNNGLPETALSEIAVFVGLDRSKFDSCLSSGKFADVVQAQYEDAVAAGGNGTPYTVMVAGGKNTPINGAVPVTQLKSIIDSAL